VSVFLLYPAAADMFGAVNRPSDYFIPLGRILIVEKTDAGFYLIGAGLIQGRPGTFDHNFIGLTGKIANGPGEGVIMLPLTIVAFGAKRQSARILQGTAAMPASLLMICHGVFR
jgi:hypothetical protein